MNHELINEPAEDTSEADYYAELDNADTKREDFLNDREQTKTDFIRELIRYKFDQLNLKYILDEIEARRLIKYANVFKFYDLSTQMEQDLHTEISVPDAEEIRNS